MKTENPVPDQPNYDAIFQMIVSIDEKVGRFGHVLETLQKDQVGRIYGTNFHISPEKITRMDRLQLINNSLQMLVFIIS